MFKVKKCLKFIFRAIQTVAHHKAYFLGYSVTRRDDQQFGVSLFDSRIKGLSLIW